MKREKKPASFLIYMCAFILVFVSNIEAGTNWETILEDDLTGIFIDNDTLRHLSETVVTAMFKIVYKEPLWIKSKYITYYLIEEEHNCEKNKYKVDRLKVYFNDGTSANFDTKEEVTVKSDTFQSIIHNFICKKKS